jgi:hypothetical protein
VRLAEAVPVTGGLMLELPDNEGVRRFRRQAFRAMLGANEETGRQA